MTEAQLSLQPDRERNRLPSRRALTIGAQAPRERDAASDEQQPRFGFGHRRALKSVKQAGAVLVDRKSNKLKRCRSSSEHIEPLAT
jgi:hypothetical protein